MLPLDHERGLTAIGVWDIIGHTYLYVMLPSAAILCLAFLHLLRWHRTNPALASAGACAQRITAQEQALETETAARKEAIALEAKERQTALLAAEIRREAVDQAQRAVQEEMLLTLGIIQAGMDRFTEFTSIAAQVMMKHVSKQNRATLQAAYKRYQRPSSDPGAPPAAGG